MRNTTKGLITLLMVCALPQAATPQNNLAKIPQAERATLEAFLPPLPAMPWWFDTVVRNPRLEAAPFGLSAGDVGPLVLRSAGSDTQLSSHIEETGTGKL